MLAQGKAEEGELRLGRCEQEIALVACGVGPPMQLRPLGRLDAPDIVAGGQGLGAEVAGDAQELLELDLLVAANARDRRLAGEVGVGEVVDHRRLEPPLEVEDVVGDADAVGDPAGIVDVLAGAAASRPARGLAMVIELQGNADDVVALLFQQRRGDRAVDAARHGDDDAGLARRLEVAERGHGRGYGTGTPGRASGSPRRQPSGSEAAPGGIDPAASTSIEPRAGSRVRERVPLARQGDDLPVYSRYNCDEGQGSSAAPPLRCC